MPRYRLEPEFYEPMREANAAVAAWMIGAQRLGHEVTLPPPARNSLIGIFTFIEERRHSPAGDSERTHVSIASIDRASFIIENWLASCRMRGAPVKAKDTMIDFLVANLADRIDDLVSPVLVDTLNVDAMFR